MLETTTCDSPELLFLLIEKTLLNDFPHDLRGIFLLELAAEKGHLSVVQAILTPDFIEDNIKSIITAT
ncbi:hypothetical protein [Candidatus Berkiella aquae]|uniref:Ankyrin repeats (3 copies) n=1 Tax=Candidatus Berkiella aquae TaxID=295108 RepID=A0A0Q9YNU8_9GAMM|nr:hypothetical protein [Candidatus Berkiella aquae]MCS5709890.1 hypothetical protein [Candidatus Berkiella aquae]